jgi:cytochrome c553
MKRTPLTRKTPMRRTGPIKAKRKAKPAAERNHHAIVATLPCIGCGAWPVEVHHVRHDGRTSITRNHRLVVPACSVCHRTGPNAIHTIGHPAFNALHGVDQYEIARQLWEKDHE